MNQNIYGSLKNIYGLGIYECFLELSFTFIMQWKCAEKKFGNAFIEQH